MQAIVLSPLFLSRKCFHGHVNPGTVVSKKCVQKDCLIDAALLLNRLKSFRMVWGGGGGGAAEFWGFGCRV